MADIEASRRTGTHIQTLTLRMTEQTWDAQPGARVVVEVVSVRQDSYPTEEST